MPAITATNVSPAPAGTLDPFALLADFTGLDLAGFDIAGGRSRWHADPHGIFARLGTPDFGAWLDHAARAGGCTSPIRLVGGTVTTDAGTGRMLDSFDTGVLPDGVLYKPCGNRRHKVCPACAKVYRYDTYHLIAAGLRGGKGVPESVALHPALFVTLVAPSFGAVHTGPAHQHGARTRCRPRRDRPVCTHGRPVYCYATHPHDSALLGTPLCLDCYDHHQQVIWNHLAPRLWDRTMTRLRKLLRLEARRLGVRVAVRYAKTAELQRRAVVHYHAVLRLDGVDRADPDALMPPPAELTAKRFAELVGQAADDARVYADPALGHPRGWVLRWGAPVDRRYADVRIIRRGIPDADLTERHVAGYLAKYVTKGTEDTGLAVRRLTPATIDVYADEHTHPGRLLDAAWSLGAPLVGADREANQQRPYRRLRYWAHQYGHGGHITTKSRRYSIRYADLRAARRAWTTAKQPSPPIESADASDEHDQAAAVVIGEWRFAGAGWLTTGDAALALAAADAARSRRPAGTNPSRLDAHAA